MGVEDAAFTISLTFLVFYLNLQSVHRLTENLFFSDSLPGLAVHLIWVNFLQLELHFLPNHFFYQALLESQNPLSQI